MSLFAMMWFTYRAWQIDYPAVPVTVPIEQGAGTAPELVPVQAPADTLPALTEPAVSVEVPVLTVSEPGRVIRVRTDVFDLMIDLQGGDIVRTDLPLFPVDKDRPDEPTRLLILHRITGGCFRQDFAALLKARSPIIWQRSRARGTSTC